MRRNSKIILVVILVLCSMSIGYSFLETNLNIGGVADVAKYAPYLTANDLINKANPEGKDYTTSTDDEKSEMYAFYHPATAQTPELTDYRYIGSKPNNYIRYNDEMWRIIGVFEGRIKIIRDESIGNMVWDSNNSNEWSTSTLTNKLNNGDYWISLSSESKSQIDVATYYLGGSSSGTLSADVCYNFERGTIVYSGRSTTWEGKVGLMYPSDYVYTFANGVDNACFNNAIICDTANPSASWLFNNDKQWTIAPASAYNDTAFSVRNSGAVSRNGVYGTYGVRPVVYLKSDTLLSGIGTSINPYIIK